jgi:twitching motility protein PilT
MSLADFVKLAIQQQATDLHLEPGCPPICRVHGGLRRSGAAVSRETLQSIADRLLPDENWDRFQERGSFDLTQVIAGVQCRINLFKTDRGVGLALRLLVSATNTIRSTNLHPQLAEFLERESGLILLTGPTGSGKSTTLSALIEEINRKSAKHIITLESPIEYRLQSKKSIIRQREVGVHTPSYEQGLMDALREDPDVIVVGEMREADAMRWTLNAAETGHLVLATMHASNAAEAVYRVMMAFPPERQSSVLAQLGDSLIAIVSQKMTFRPEQALIVPCLEILVGNYATKNAIRKGEAAKLQSLLQTGGQEGQWTFERYQTWLDAKTDWVKPEPPVVSNEPLAEEGELVSDQETASSSRVNEDRVTAGEREVTGEREAMESPRRPASTRAMPSYARASASHTTQARYAGSTTRSEARSASRGASAGRTAATKIHKDGRIEIPEMDLDLNELVKSFNPRDEES